jgi:sirohydrochlorin ferrochelatase
MVAVAHGTADVDGRRNLAELIERVRHLKPGLDVTLAWLDHAEPDVGAALHAQAGPVVVVPLLLAQGYHVERDLPGRAGKAIIARRLGPDPALTEVLHDRLAEAGAAPEAATVLLAAGSADPAAQRDVAEQARLLARRRDAPVSAAFLAGPGPRVADVVDRCAATRRPIAVASYLLGHGRFHRLAIEAASAAGFAVTAPLAPHERLAELALRRYDEAIA